MLMVGMVSALLVVGGLVGQSWALRDSARRWRLGRLSVIAAGTGTLGLVWWLNDLVAGLGA